MVTRLVSRVFTMDEKCFSCFKEVENKQYFTGWNEEGFGMKIFCLVVRTPGPGPALGIRWQPWVSFLVPQLDFVALGTPFLRV